MSRKATIAVLAAAVMALAAAPSGASAAETCPPGTSSGEYCETTETTGLETAQHVTTVSKSDVVEIALHCAQEHNCKGKLEFLSLGGGKAARRSHGHSAARKHVIVYGVQRYSIKAKSSKKVGVHLDPKGRKALQKKGGLTVVVVAISEGVRERIATLHIKAKKSSHSTHAKSEPDFTG